MATIQYSDVEITERLPIDAQDVVDEVRLVIAGNYAGQRWTSLINRQGDPPTSGSVGTPVVYTALPLTYRYVTGNNYGAKRTFGLPEGIDPFLPPNHPDVPEPSHVSGFTLVGDPSAIRDGDPTTYVEGGPGSIRYDVDSVAKMVGFRIIYTTGKFADAGISLHFGLAPVWTSGIYKLEASTTETETTALLLLDARTANENRGLPPDADPTPPFGVLEGAPEKASVGVLFQTTARITHFYPLIPNETLLNSIARGNVRQPATSPQRVTVRGYVAPDREHTITGWPGGDFTGTVAQVQYELGRTVIDFEQAGAPLGLPAEALEAARERKVAIDRAVSEAAYPVTMGERQ